MKLRIALAGLLLVCSATTAFAHRVDEYLQAAMLNLAGDRVEINLRLTPGIEVLGKVLAAIDRDGDGTISTTEQQAYADMVCREVSLTVDGELVPLAVKSATFPTLPEMKEGVGDIAIRFESPMPASGGSHRLLFENCHQPDISVYLANSLVPARPDVAITEQTRNLDQSMYRVDYTQSADGARGAIGTAAQPENWLKSTGSASIFAAFFYQGVRHILTGYDHLLFVSALVLAVTTLWELVKVVSAFTIAHTITLTLAALNLIHVSESIVEPLIAGSIVFVAAQNIFSPRQSHGWGRLGAAFFFGLFHGLGFAGGLLEAMQEMQTGVMFLAIFAFSVGVETGHQMIVLPLFGALKLARQTRHDVVARTQFSMNVQRIGSSIIFLAGIYYLWVQLAGRA
jgi:hydrogenase/urease accessory protein HupE